MIFRNTGNANGMQSLSDTHWRNNEMTKMRMPTLQNILCCLVNHMIIKERNLDGTKQEYNQDYLNKNKAIFRPYH